MGKMGCAGSLRKSPGNLDKVAETNLAILLIRELKRGPFRCSEKIRNWNEALQIYCCCIYKLNL